jgi:membrane protease YdiL (CAAX protease family)
VVKVFLSIASLSLMLILAGVAGATVRIVQLEKGELEHESYVRTLNDLLKKPGSTPISVRLDEVTLRAGEQVVFEVCAQDPLRKEQWRGVLTFAVLYLDELKLMFKTPLDEAHLQIAKRDGGRACLVLGGGRIESSGRYSIDAVWYDKRPAEEVMQVGFYTRVIGKTPLLAGERLWVIAIAAGAMLFLLTLFYLSIPKRTLVSADPSLAVLTIQGTESMGTGRQRLGGLFVALLSVAVLWVAIARTPFFGSAMGFLKGLMIAVVEIGVALWLARRLDPRRNRVSNLALVAPHHRPLLALAISALCAGALVLIAKVALLVIPATSEAPIQTFVAWPSGILCFAALGVVVPLGEEVFFRGFVYRAALGYGRSVAFAVALLSFVGLHVQQVWGNWGGLAALTVTGIVLTGLRAYSGSTLLPAVTHLLYNFVLSMGSF